ncbi:MULTISPECIES: hypothetical protein [unclassified Nocardia]
MIIWPGLCPVDFVGTGVRGRVMLLGDMGRAVVRYGGAVWGAVE